MNLEVKGMSATSRVHAKSQSLNQLGMGWRKQLPCSEFRPPEVPCLDLGKLGDSDDEDSYIPLSKGYPRFAPPDSSSTVSWGSPLPTPQQSQRHQIVKHSNRDKSQLSLTELKHIPENLPSPADKYRLKYQQYEEEMKQSYKQYTKRCADKDKTKQNTHQPTYNIVKQKDLKPEELFADLTPLDEKAQLQQSYTGKPYSGNQSLRKIEAEDLAAERRKQAVVEQVMVDQLSRAVISDPEQNAASSLNVATQRDLASAPLRFRNRTLHDTMIKTSKSLTENILSYKLRFDARIICRNGRDACRELIGFFFAHDKSVTIYEYRQFGKNRTNALPFIQKGIYYHHYGWKRGEAYELSDFYIGANLTFLTKEHQTLPESLKEIPMLIIRITAIDEQAMDSLRGIINASKIAPNVPLKNESNILLEIQDFMKEKLKNRGVRTLTGLGKYFRQLDKNGNGILQRAEFEQAMKTFHLEVSEKIFESLWLMLDENHEGKLDYERFTYALVGEMNEYRKAFVRKAFMKLDHNKSGKVPMIDIRKFYCARKHPQVLAGNSTEEEILSAFLETLEDACMNRKEVTYREFIDYYEGLSIGIQSNDDFVNILRNSWGV
ncbi:hypothetical protein GDO86_005754 [Hymenochirus boettgeri]|uniref:EF-hand domain-containing protein n=1 Tax=Hymenochirus boettgeri TaxID=247094 RepID=A0A8T2J8F5_9PIPI|nr:hypothetical protein GDO86_005754 [Hymenochirus boettgeri]